jgi:hypothetical protein
MYRRNSRLLVKLALLGCAQMQIGWPWLEYAARAAVPAALACDEAPQGVDENEMAAICEARKRADAEQEKCAQGISCEHEWRDVMEAWEAQRVRVSKVSRE